MSNRTKTQFKTWQPLPALAGGRTECPPQDPGARAGDSQRPGSADSAAGRKPAFRKPAEGSRKLKFFFTTHD